MAAMRPGNSVVHDMKSEHLERYLGDRFVWYARHNHNSFDSYDEEVKNYIENHKMVATTEWFNVVYVFE